MFAIPSCVRLVELGRFPRWVMFAVIRSATRLIALPDTLRLTKEMRRMPSSSLLCQPSSGCS